LPCEILPHRFLTLLLNLAKIRSKFKGAKMKKIGLIGGMSYESTIAYYQLINKKINEGLGGLNSGEILLSSVNFEHIEEC